MSRFINLKVSKSFNYLIINNKSNDKKTLSTYNNEAKFPYDIILNNLIIFLYKKLTPFLFQEVKSYLNSQYLKYRNKINKDNNNSNQTYNNEASFISDNNININNNINLTSRKNLNNPLKDMKNKIELKDKTTKTNYLGKKVYIPKSEQKKIHSINSKYKNLKKNKNKKNKNSYNKSKSKNNNSSKKLFYSDDYDLFNKKNINEMTSIKTLINNQVSKHKTASKNKKKKNIFQSKLRRDNSQNSSRNYSISDSRSIFSVSNQKSSNSKKNQKIISNIIYTGRQYNDNKNNILDNNKIYNSSKKINLTKSQPLLNEKLLYKLIFNNNYNINNENHINTLYINNFAINSSLKKLSEKKNNLKVYQGNIGQKFFNIKKTKTNNKTTIIQKPLLNSIKSQKHSKVSNSYSTMNKNNINNIKINSQKRNNNINALELNYKSKINGIENKNNIKEDNITSTDNNNEENKNIKNKKCKLLNEEMMKKIKNTVDDNLKIMFSFSYVNFLSKESEQESKEYSLERNKFIEERNFSGERY